MPSCDEKYLKIWPFSGVRSVDGLNGGDQHVRGRMKSIPLAFIPMVWRGMGSAVVRKLFSLHTDAPKMVPKWPFLGIFSVTPLHHARVSISSHHRQGATQPALGHGPYRSCLAPYRWYVERQASSPSTGRTLVRSQERGASSLLLS